MGGVGNMLTCYYLAVIMVSPVFRGDTLKSYVFRCFIRRGPTGSPSLPAQGDDARDLSSRPGCRIENSRNRSGKLAKAAGDGNLHQSLLDSVEGAMIMIRRESPMNTRRDLCRVAG